PDIRLAKGFLRSTTAVVAPLRPRIFSPPDTRRSAFRHLVVTPVPNTGLSDGTARSRLQPLPSIGESDESFWDSCFTDALRRVPAGHRALRVAAAGGRHLGRRRDVPVSHLRQVGRG